MKKVLAIIIMLVLASALLATQVVIKGYTFERVKDQKSGFYTYLYTGNRFAEAVESISYIFDVEMVESTFVQDDNGGTQIGYSKKTGKLIQACVFYMDGRVWFAVNTEILYK